MRVDRGLVVAARSRGRPPRRPASATSASSIGRFESRIWPGRERPRPSTSSSPVESTPTRDAPVHRHLGARRAIASTPRCAGASTVPAVEHDVAGLDVATRGAGCGRPRSAGTAMSTPSVTVALGALDHHDRVGAVGHRRAGHDPDRLARPDRHRRRVPGREVAHDAQPHRRVGRRAGGVGGPHRVAVHRGVGERRHRARRRRRRPRARARARRGSATVVTRGAARRGRGSRPARPRARPPRSHPSATRRTA